jgi:hypothetical protein
MDFKEMQQTILTAISRAIDADRQWKGDQIEWDDYQRRLGIIADGVVQEIALDNPSMSTPTFKALERVMKFARQHGADEVSEDFQVVLDWMQDAEVVYKADPNQ